MLSAYNTPNFLADCGSNLQKCRLHSSGCGQRPIKSAVVKAKPHALPFVSTAKVVELANLNTNVPRQPWLTVDDVYSLHVALESVDKVYKLQFYPVRNMELMSSTPSSQHNNKLLVSLNIPSVSLKDVNFQEHAFL